MRHPGHAVVVGAGMAGLVAGRVLADHFERVTIVDRDRLPDEPVGRRAVPQAQHFHVLWARGRQILEDLLPGLGEELVSAGAPEGDLGTDTVWLTPAGWGVRFTSGIRLVSASRQLLEHVVRRRVERLPNVVIQGESVVVGLLGAGSSGRVTGVRVRDGIADRELAANLVVDASGRASRAPEWLVELGCRAPEETVVDASLLYASRFYAAPPEAGDGWRGVYVQPAPPSDHRGAVLAALEGNRWILTLIGLGGDHPPADEDGFGAFLAGLRSPVIAEFVRRVRPVSGVVRYRATSNRLRHYEQLASFPDGFLVLGDAACAFNPVYGQGMTTAATSAAELDRLLRGRDAYERGFARRFQRRLAKVNATPWLLATSEDLRVKGVTGPTAVPSVRLMHRYLDRVTALSTHDPEVRLALLRTMNMLDTPYTLFRPPILLRVAALSQRRTSALGRPWPWDRSPGRRC